MGKQDSKPNQGQDTEITPTEQSAPEPIKTTAPAASELDLELKRLELEAKRLEVEYQKANLVDMQERLQERELKRENSRARGRINGEVLASTKANHDRVMERCNHRKGGNGQAGVVSGQGDDSQYAVLKHTFPNGDMWVRCLRCGKTWKPPVESVYPTKEAYLKDVAEYHAAVNFSTRNVPSSSIAFKFSDGGQHYREVTAHSNLR